MPTPSAHTESSIDGRRPVSEVMTRGVISVDSTEPMAAVRRLLEGASYHHLPVVEDGRLVGMISVRNLALASVLECAPHGHACTARDVMTHEPAQIQPECPLASAAASMLEHGVGALPVVDASHALLGIVTRTDLLRVMASART